jgi:hypothetical protein
MLKHTEILNLLQDYKHVIGWFSGHKHSGDYGNYNYVHCLTFKSMVEIPESNAYAVVELYHNKIWIKGRGRMKGQILAY